MRRHQEAAEVVLAKLENPNALLAENLQHLAWALDHIQATGDGLAQPWFGRVWLNPPYSKPAPWVDRFIEHGHGIALLPTSSNAKWLNLLWVAADGIALPSRCWFHKPDGTTMTAQFTTLLWALGDDCVEAIGRVSRVRR